MGNKARLVGVGAAMAVVAVGSILAGFKAADRVDGRWLWFVDALAIALPAVLALSGRRLQRPRLALVALLVLPVCFALAGGATMRLALEWRGVARPSLAAPVGAVAAVLVAWGCQAIALHATLTQSRLLFGMKESGLLMAIRQGPWAAGVLGAFGFALQLHALVPNPSLTAIALASVGGAIVLSYLCALAVMALLSSISGPVPAALTACLDDARRLTGIAFARVVYLDRSLASGTLCEVRPHWRGHALVINRETVDRLAADECLAVLTHEAAHVRQQYFVKEIVVSGALSMIYILAIVSAANALQLGVLTGITFAALGAVLNSTLYAAYRRWLERDADRYAAQLVGIEPMLRALAKLSPPVPPTLLSLHDSFDVRAARVRSVGAE